MRWKLWFRSTEDVIIGLHINMLNFSVVLCMNSLTTSWKYMRFWSLQLQWWFCWLNSECDSSVMTSKVIYNGALGGNEGEEQCWASSFFFTLVWAAKISPKDLIHWVRVHDEYSKSFHLGCTEVYRKWKFPWQARYWWPYTLYCG